MNVEDLLLAYIQKVNLSVSTKDEVDSIAPDEVGDIGIDLANILRQILPTQNRFTVTAGTDVPVGGADTDLYFQSGLNQITIWRNSNGEWISTAIIPTGLTSLVDGKLTGLRVALSGFVATITDGSWIIDNGLYKKETQTQIQIAPAHATLFRYDSIYANKSNAVLLSPGVASETPIAPEIPDDSILVETITVPSVASGKVPFSEYSQVDISGKADTTYVDQQILETNNQLTENVEALQTQINEKGIGKPFGAVVNNTTNCVDFLDIREISNAGDLNLEINFEIEPAVGNNNTTAISSFIKFSIPNYYIGAFTQSNYPSDVWLEIPITQFRGITPNYLSNILKVDIKRIWGTSSYKLRLRATPGAIGSSMYYGLFVYGYTKVWFANPNKNAVLESINNQYFDVAAVTKISGVTVGQNDIWDSAGKKFLKEDSAGVVHTSGAETVAGPKNFTDLMSILNATADNNPVALGQYFNLVNTARYWRIQRKIPSIRILVPQFSCYEFLKMIPTNNYVYCRISVIANSSVKSYEFVGGYDMTLNQNGQWKQLTPDIKYKDRTQDFEIDIRVIPDNGPTNSGIEFRARNYLTSGGTIELTISLDFSLALPSWQTNFEQFDQKNVQYAWDGVTVPLYGKKLTLTNDGLNYVDPDGAVFLKGNSATITNLVSQVSSLQAQIDKLKNAAEDIVYTLSEYNALSAEAAYTLTEYNALPSGGENEEYTLTEYLEL